MNITPLQQPVDASHLPLESLAGSQVLTQDQKIAEASRQFEAVLLRQFLAESQKPVIQSEFTDNSSAAGIYQDMITNQLADSLSRNGGVGLAKTFERQLSRTSPQTQKTSNSQDPRSNIQPDPSAQATKAATPQLTPLPLSSAQREKCCRGSIASAASTTVKRPEGRTGRTQ
jgi:flagellar protein FlgJ